MIRRSRVKRANHFFPILSFDSTVTSTITGEHVTRAQRKARDEFRERTTYKQSFFYSVYEEHFGRDPYDEIFARFSCARSFISFSRLSQQMIGPLSAINGILVQQRDYPHHALLSPCDIIVNITTIHLFINSERSNSIVT